MVYQSKTAGKHHTHISMRVVCWHIEVGDHHVGHLNDSYVKPLVFFLYRGPYRGRLRGLFLRTEMTIRICAIQHLSLVQMSKLTRMEDIGMTHPSLNAIGHLC